MLNLTEFNKIDSLLKNIIIQEPNDQITHSFEGKCIPGISLHLYIVRIMKYLKYYFKEIDDHHSPVPFLDIAIKYIERTNVPINQKNAHRLFLLGLVVASKFIMDYPPNNEWFSIVGGISLKELNKLEHKFILSLKWDLFIKEEETNLPPLFRPLRRKIKSTPHKN